MTIPRRTRVLVEAPDVKIPGWVEHDSPNSEWVLVHCELPANNLLLAFPREYVVVETPEPFDPLKLQPGTRVHISYFPGSIWNGPATVTGIEADKERVWAVSDRTHLEGAFPAECIKEAQT